MPLSQLALICYLPLRCDLIVDVVVVDVVVVCQNDSIVGWSADRKWLLPWECSLSSLFVCHFLIASALNFLSSDTASANVFESSLIAFL